MAQKFASYATYGSDQINFVGNTYYVVGTQTATTNVWTGAMPGGLTAYYDGLTIDYFLPYAGNSSAATLNLGGLGAKPVYYRGTSAVTTHFPIRSVIHLTYVVNSSMNSGNGAWEATGFYLDGNSNTVPSGYCETAAATAAKAASCTNYTATAKTYFHILMRYANTSATALTLNVNGQGAKPIYINGSASSTSNYTLPAGTYLVYYDGTNYYFRNDGIAPLNVEKVNGSTINNGTLTIQKNGTTVASFTANSSTNVVANIPMDDVTVITETLYASNWSDGAYILTNSKLLATGYTYIISPKSANFTEWSSCFIIPGDVVSDGYISFTCDATPSTDIIVTITRYKTGTGYGAITGTIAVSNWSNNAATLSVSGLIANGYLYQVSPQPSSTKAWNEAVIYADDITTDGKITFHCDTTPEAAISYIILKQAVV